MLLLDANPLLYALREDAPTHREWSSWLEGVLDEGTQFGVCSATWAAVVRIATSGRVFKQPTPLDVTLRFLDGVRDGEGFVLAEPGVQHWGLMERLCRATGAKGNLVSDVYLAALALELDATVVTADADFRRFPGVRSWNPLSGAPRRGR